MAFSSLVRTVARVAALVGLATVLLVPGTASARETHGVVLDAAARPHGYSLTKMTRQLALFTTSRNDLAYYPDTPIQVLYFDRATQQDTFPDGGWLVTGTNSFTVKPGTPFFVPLQNADDSPPVLGVFPGTPSDAKPYFFDQTQLGARDITIIVDGVSTPIGPEYVAGPVQTPPLLDGGGTHMVTLGAFLRPLAPGTHTVRITGGLYGDLLPPTYHVNFFAADFTYQVTVAPGTK